MTESMAESIAGGGWVLQLERLSGRFVVCRLEPGASVAPEWLQGEFSCLTRTSEETSLVCAEAMAPPGARVEGPFRALKVAGPLDFALTGILAAIARVLAEAEISIFAISTFDTDYVLVGADSLEAAESALRDAGHQVASS